jgi:glycosyltransferase involved in cell wall biosynthesis
MRVCYFGTYDKDYPRNRIVVDGLRANGVEVYECNVPLWSGTEERLQRASGGWLTVRFLSKVVAVYSRLVRQELAMPAYDVMLVGYPGQFDMYWARFLSWRRRVPLVFDVLMSLYLLMEERDLVARHPVTARITYWMEKGACILADRIIMDTTAYVRYFCDTYGLSPDKFRLAPLGADQRVYYPIDVEKKEVGEFKVNYYGSYLPLHGVEHIVEAARLLRREPDIRFELIGRGPLKSQAVETARRFGLGNVTFIDWVDKYDLLNYVGEADVCLGVFGTSHQSLCTVQNKIWEGLAMAKPVITGDAPMVREVMTHGEDLYLCQRADPQALADAIVTLRDDPTLRRQLAENGYRLYRKNYTTVHTGKRFKTYLEEVLNDNA